MELKITHLTADDICLMDYAGSAAELGDCAGTITWQNALNDGARLLPLETEEQLQSARDYFSGFGAWLREDIERWTTAECSALLLQFIAGYLREYLTAKKTPETFDRWNENCGGHIYEGDDGELYAYIGE